MGEGSRESDGDVSDSSMPRMPQDGFATPARVTEPLEEQVTLNAIRSLLKEELNPIKTEVSTLSASLGAMSVKVDSAVSIANAAKSSVDDWGHLDLLGA